MNIVQKAATLAERWHDKEANQKYNGHPYSHHLWQTAKAGEKYILEVEESRRENVLAACWLHDTIEDARVTYSDLLTKFNREVAELVYACTNEKGRNRRERANDKFYRELHQVPYAWFVKCCDRIANVRFSVENNSPQLEMYRKENDAFMQKLWLPANSPMRAELIHLLSFDASRENVKPIEKR